jgi:hypothetical protein
MLMDTDGASLLSARGGRFISQWHMEPITSMVELPEPARPNWGRYLLLSRKAVWHWEGSTRAEPQLLLENTQAACGLHFAGEERGLLLADNFGLSCFSRAGEELWRAECHNYVGDPLLGVLDAGSALVYEGPQNPRLKRISLDDGAELESIPLQAAALAFLPGLPGSGPPLLVEEGSGSQEPCQLVSLSSGANGVTAHRRPALPGVFMVKPHPQGFCALFLNTGEVACMDSNGRILWRLVDELPIRDAALLPEHEIFAILVGRGAEAQVRCYPLTHQTAHDYSI